MKTLTKFLTGTLLAAFVAQTAAAADDGADRVPE